ncbi:MAG: hypothetical protein IPO58_04515 [Betaproteobacteria bacterium]|nr:hypothetical protein [Betaproteobacteria bacterium]
MAYNFNFRIAGQLTGARRNSRRISRSVPGTDRSLRPALRSHCRRSRKKDLDGTRRESKTALALNQIYAEAIGTHGLIEIYSGNPLSGIPFLERAISLDPAFTHQCMRFLGTVYLVAGNAQRLQRLRFRGASGFRRKPIYRAACSFPRSGIWAKSTKPAGLDSELKRVSPAVRPASHVARAVPQPSRWREHRRGASPGPGYLRLTGAWPEPDWQGRRNRRGDCRLSGPRHDYRWTDAEEPGEFTTARLR